MMNRFLLAVFLGALLAWLAGAPQPLLAQTNPADSVAPPAALSFDAAGFPTLDAGWQAALAHVIAAEQSDLPGPTPYTLTAFDTYQDASGEWALAVIVPSATVQAGWEDLDLDQLVDVLLHRTPEGRVEGHVRTNAAFLSLAGGVPRRLVDYSPLLAVRSSAPAESVSYLFPWTAGQTWWGGGGWHTGYGSNALDFGPFQDDAPAEAVLAAAGGTLRMVCENDDQQRLLWIEHPNGERTGYLHLDRASVRAAVEEMQLVGQVVPQGTYLGTVYTGEAKIDGSCPASFPNCTFNTICGYGNAPHVHFVLPSRDVVIDGIAADGIGSGNAGDRFTSSNTRQDGPAAPTPTPTPTPTPMPLPDTEPPTALLVQPLGDSGAVTPAQDATLAVQLVVTDTGGGEAASSGVASVEVQVAWQQEDGAWQPDEWVQADAGTEDVYTAAVAACTPTWRVPHNRPLRISLRLRDKAGNQAYNEAAAVLRYAFPDLNRDCIVEIKDVMDLLPALRDGAKARPEHDVDGDGSVTAADGAALLAAVFGSPQPAAMPATMRAAQGAAADVFGLPSLGSSVQFAPLSAPVLPAGVRDVSPLDRAALLVNWRTNDMPLVQVGKTLGALLLTPLMRSGSGYSVTAAGSLVYAGSWQNADLADPSDPAGLSNIGVWDLAQPLTPTLVTTFTLPGEVMESTVVSGQLYAAAGYAGLHLVDVTTLPTPTLLATLDTPGIATDVSALDDLVYVADQDNGLLIYRTQQLTPTAPLTLSPSHPLTLSLLATWDTPGDAIGVTAALSTVYVADGLGGVQIVDASDPASPRLLATYATTSAANSTIISGTTLFVAAGWQGVLALDVSNPAAPYLAGSYDTPGYVYDLALIGDRLLVADGPGGLQVLQVDQQAAPAHFLLIPFVAK